jgi:hypothetical protein
VSRSVGGEEGFPVYFEINLTHFLYAGVLFALCTTAEGGGINHKRSCPNGRS